MSKYVLIINIFFIGNEHSFTIKNIFYDKMALRPK